MPTLNNILVFLFLSLGLRWFLFQYKLLHPIREWLAQWEFFEELFSCPYCQTFEASVVVYFLLGMPFTPIIGFLCGLFNAYIAIAIENTVERQIDELEGIELEVYEMHPDELN